MHGKPSPTRNVFPVEAGFAPRAAHKRLSTDLSTAQANIVLYVPDIQNSLSVTRQAESLAYVADNLGLKKHAVLPTVVRSRAPPTVISSASKKGLKRLREEFDPRPKRVSCGAHSAKRVARNFLKTLQEQNVSVCHQAQPLEVPYFGFCPAPEVRFELSIKSCCQPSSPVTAQHISTLF